jgi:hypothetical protein
MTMLVFGLALSHIAVFAAGWYAYSKWGAKVQAIGTTLASDLKK